MRGPARTGRPLGKIVLNKCMKEVYNKGVERMVLKPWKVTMKNMDEEWAEAICEKLKEYENK